MAFAAVEERDAEDGAVGGNEWQVDAEYAVQERALFGEEEFGEADDDGDADDEGDGAQEFDAVGFEEPGVERPGGDGGEGEDEGGGKAHAEGGVDFARYAHEGA